MRIDPEVKAKSEKVFTPLGLSISEAVNIFLHRAILEGGLPFDVRQPRYDREVEAAMREVEDMLAGRIPMRKYASVEEMNADLDGESL